MKTRNKTLTFKKNAVVELNESHLAHINGGSSPTITAPITSIIYGTIIVYTAGTFGVKPKK